mmetsp:Transcript_18220/g.41518  ORF Transcript_18220/g.41518 Transcript_18220/m.41518 type:complete len:205 (+) Transcript_18220:822-1436(+)
MESTVQIGITSNDKRFPNIEVHQPVFYHRSFCEEITARRSIHRIVVFAGVLLFLHRKGNSARRISGHVDKTLPDSRTVEINRDDIGTKCHEHAKRSHGRSSTKKHKILIAEVKPLWVVNTLADSNTAVWFDGAVFHPFFNLSFNSITLEHFAFVRNFELVFSTRLLSFDESRAEFFSVIHHHSLLERTRRAIGRDKLERAIHVL